MEPRVAELLNKLEARERKERERPDQLSLDQRLMAVGPEAGALINQLIKSLSPASIIELGTSYGYSTLWLAEAARVVGAQMMSIDVDHSKQSVACQLLQEAGLENVVDFRAGRAEQVLPLLDLTFDFVFIDVWKDAYVSCLDAIWPKLAPMAVIVADNMVRPRSYANETDAYRRDIRGRVGVESVMLPAGNGLEISYVRRGGAKGSSSDEFGDTR